MSFRLISVLCSGILFIASLFSLFPLYSQSDFDPQAFTEDWVEQMFFTRSNQAQLPEFNDSYGVVFKDLNNDSLADIYVVRFRDLNRLFLNRGTELPYLDYTITSGLGGNLMSFGNENLELGASAADFNNDGLQDILTVGWGLTTYLHHHDDEMRFVEKTPLAEVFHPIDGNAGIWADIDRDGDLDLFITDEHYQNHLLINNGVDDFRDASEEYGIVNHATSQGAAFGDVNGDDYPDLYVCNWLGRDMFYQNVDGKKFVSMDLPLQHTANPGWNSNGVSFGDVDNDGDLDLLVTDRQGGTRLYQNFTPPGSDDWEFFDITDSTGLFNPYPAYGSVIADFNNDGWLDIFFTNIGPNLLYLNTNAGYFELVYEGIARPTSKLRHYSTGAAVADHDNDGDLDIFVANKDTLSVLYQNPLNDSDFVRIRPEGVMSNRDAVGVKIWLYSQAGSDESADEDAAILIGYREISGGSGYLSLNEPIAHFGVISGEPLSARIRFPSGEETFLDNLATGRTYTVSETGGIQKSIIRFYQQIKRLVRGKGFLLDLMLFILWLGMVIGFILLSIRRYHWQNWQTALFLISAMVVGFFLFLLLSGQEFWFIFLIQITALISFGALIAGFQEKIHRLEVQRSGSRQLLQNFTQQLIFIKNNEELYDQMVSTVQASMKVNYSSLLEIKRNLKRSDSGDNDGSNFSAVFKAAAGNWGHQSFSMQLTPENRSNFLDQPIIRVQSIHESFPELIDVGAHLVIPLMRKEKLFALLLLADREDHKELPAEDLALLQILAGQAAIAIENNLYIEESTRLTQKLTEAEIQAKYTKELETKNKTLRDLNREIQETQTQLIQSEKMAGLGQLVAGIAHELNNPISFVYANMRELQQYTAAITELLSALQNGLKPETLKEKLKELDDKYDLNFIQKDIDNLIGESLVGSQRVKDVVQNLRNFSRLDEAEHKKVDLHEGLESTLVLLNNEIKNRIRLHKAYSKDLPQVYCNPGQINQVFMNLLHNATQAVEKEGDIWITTSSNGKTVEIEIRDNGRGIPKHVQGKIFDPFFTTKPVGKGTGLGLSICYNIIQKHGGKILLDSKEGDGTKFTIVLPLKGG